MLRWRPGAEGGLSLGICCCWDSASRCFFCPIFRESCNGGGGGGGEERKSKRLSACLGFFIRRVGFPLCGSF